MRECLGGDFHAKARRGQAATKRSAGILPALDVRLSVAGGNGAAKAGCKPALLKIFTAGGNSGAGHRKGAETRLSEIKDFLAPLFPCVFALNFSA